MCKSFKILSELDALILRDLIYEYKLDAYVDTEDDIGFIREIDMNNIKYRVVIIEGIDDTCLCSLNHYQQERLIDFIRAITVM
jgi:hypothetical protein